MIPAEGEHRVVYNGHLDLALMTRLMKRRVAILISGRGSNMAALIKAACRADFPAEIVARDFQQAPTRCGLERAKASGIATRW